MFSMLSWQRQVFRVTWYLLFMVSVTVAINRKLNTVYEDLESWEDITTDCPHHSCAYVLNSTAFIALNFRRDSSHIVPRKFVWLYNSTGFIRARVIMDEYEGNSVTLYDTCGSHVIFRNAAQQRRANLIVMESSPLGLMITFPDGTKWGHCTTWDVNRVSFDKFRQRELKSKFVTTPPTSRKGICDGCRATDYCRANSVFCEGATYTIDSCGHFDASTHMDDCTTCQEADAVIGCNHTRECVSTAQLCDSFHHCRDGEDEYDCTPEELRRNSKKHTHGSSELCDHEDCNSTKHRPSSSGRSAIPGLVVMCAVVAYI